MRILRSFAVCAAQKLRRNPERGGAEGRKRRIFGHTGRTWPNCTDRTIGRAARPVVPPALGGQRGSGVTKDPSLPPLGPTLAQDFFTAAQHDGTACERCANTARAHSTDREHPSY